MKNRDSSTGIFTIVQQIILQNNTSQLSQCVCVNGFERERQGGKEKMVYKRNKCTMLCEAFNDGFHESVVAISASQKYMKYVVSGRVSSKSSKNLGESSSRMKMIL